jgi:hypothetical protein
MSYTVTTASGTVLTATSKDRAIKLGSETNEAFTVSSKSGKVVHTFELPADVPAKPGKVCKKDPTHGEHRVTKSGSYCYACDRIVAERQKAERAAAKAAS